MALKYYEKAYTISQAIGHRSHEATWLGSMGHVWQAIGRFDDALSCYSAAVKLGEEIDSLELQGVFLANLGMTYRTVGDIDKAISALTKAEEVMATTGSRNLDHVRSALHALQTGNASNGT